jgi:hypothetical protein
MIISHAYKYVFLGTRRTGSNSSELFLLQNLFEKGDIANRSFTPKYVHPEVIRPPTDNVPPGVKARWDMKYLIDYSGIDITGYKVFAVLRHPHDRLVSRVFYPLTLLGCRNLFHARHILSNGFADDEDRERPQSAFFKYEGRMVAEVWRYTEINTLFPEFVRSYGKEVKYPLTRLESQHTPTWANPKTVFTPEIIQKVNEVFAEDIELYNIYYPESKIL